MTSRYIGRIESHVSRKICSASASNPAAKRCLRKYATAPVSESTASNTAPSTPSLQPDRDPSLPPKPPPGTYPHPHPNSRDDPHSNSMRINYQLPASTTQKRNWQSPHIPAGQSAFSNTNYNATSTGKWAGINTISGIDAVSGSMFDPKALAPLYVVHIKSTSNNTIITLHAPGMPKSQNIVRNTSRGGAKSPVAPGAYSVESNPDAVPPELDMGASEPSESTQASSGTGSDVVVQPAVADLPPSASFTPPAANRCIGWASGGSCHYKKVNRSTYEAGYSASIRIIRRVEEAFQHVAGGGKIEELAPMKEVKGATSTLSEALRSQGTSRSPFRVRVVYTGFGTGREAFNAAVLSADGAFMRGLIVQVQDKTPIKVGGCRGKKTRRV